MIPTLLSSASLNYFTDRLLMIFINLLPFIAVIIAWVFAIVLFVRKQNPKLGQLLRVLFLVLLVVTISMSVFYITKSQREIPLYWNTEGCIEPANNTTCPTDNDFISGIMWGFLSVILLFMNIVLLILARVRKNSNTTEEKAVKRNGS
jgi:drug/metabolite transporter (DMT)-like permease